MVKRRCPLVVTSLSASPAAPAGRPAVGEEHKWLDWCQTAPGCMWTLSGWWLTCLFTFICQYKQWPQTEGGLFWSSWQKGRRWWQVTHQISTDWIWPLQLAILQLQGLKKDRWADASCGRVLNTQPQSRQSDPLCCFHKHGGLTCSISRSSCWIISSSKAWKRFCGEKRIDEIDLSQNAEPH